MRNRAWKIIPVCSNQNPMILARMDFHDTFFNLSPVTTDANLINNANGNITNVANDTQGPMPLYVLAVTDAF